MNIVIFGPPGAGKGTQSKFIVNKYNLHQLSTGDLLRKEIKNKTKLGSEISSIINSGELVSDKIVSNLIEKFISNDTFNQHPNLIIIGGTPRGDISPDDFKASVLNELSQQSINKITINELNNAKARIKANNVYKFDSVFYQAMQVGMLETKGISWENLDNYSSIVESITLDEVLKAGEIYFSNDRLLTTVLRPKK